LSEINDVVAHFLDGKIMKGLTRDFFPNQSAAFHLCATAAAPPHRIRLSDVKAIFFVRDLEGDSRRRDIRGFLTGPAETRHGKKISVLFPDGELVCGYTHSYSPQRSGFFVYPSDAGSNNLRIYVNVSPGTLVAQRAAAEELAQRILDSQAA
jgi:hypothetical protein